ncbi:MAG: hypothetical protein KGL63_09490 [Betaproteobacteria bacterium]|nr:hypothetical protein [Betaproteobacteria bacterium]
MTDDQDVSIAILQQRLAEAEKRITEISNVAYALRDDRLRIEGGKWVLWVLGSVVMAIAGFAFYVSGMFRNPHGG